MNAPSILPPSAPPSRAHSDYELLLVTGTRRHWRPLPQQQQHQPKMSHDSSYGAALRSRWWMGRTALRSVVASASAAAGGGHGLYGVLGVEQGVSVDAIKSAYRRLARQYHPDVCRRSEDREAFTRKFMEAHQAYEVLSDPARRADYDLRMSGQTADAFVVFCSSSSSSDRSRRRRRRRSTTTSAVVAAAASAVWKLQWEAQLLRMKRSRDQKRRSSSHSIFNAWNRHHHQSS